MTKIEAIKQKYRQSLCAYDVYWDMQYLLSRIDMALSGLIEIANVTKNPAEVAFNTITKMKLEKELPDEKIDNN